MALKIGVIGCGYWGPNLIRNFNQIEATNVCYVCDLDETKTEPIKKTYPAVKVTKNYKDVLSDPQVDAVVIATPVAFHFDLAKAALLSDKHVLIEKPMASSVAQAQELVQIAGQQNKVLMVDHTFEYAEAINKIKDIVDSGQLGQLYYMRGEWLNLGLLQPDINVIWDLATHIFSIVNYVSGLKPVSLNANAGAYVRKDIQEVAHIHVKFMQNVCMDMAVSWLEPKKTRMLTIVGDKKMLVYDLTNTEEQIKIYDKGVAITNMSEDMRQLRINYRYGDICSPNVKNIESLSVMCSHFADCIINNTRPRSDGLSGLNIVKMLEASQKSLEADGKKIALT